MMEKTLQYSSKPTRKSFYFQSKVSVWRAVLHGQTPYQHCDSSMQYNLQDQRFQKILVSALQASPEKFPTFQAVETKVLRVHPKTANTPWLSMVAQATPSKPLSPSWASVMLAKTALRMSMNRTKKLIYLGGWVSFSWINCTVLFLPCWHITGVAQGREKQAREKSICLHWLKHLYNT